MASSVLRYNMVFSSLNELSTASKNWTVRVRVSGLWEYCGGRDGGALLHVNLVLVDVDGNAMYAEIPGREFERIRGVICEGDIYILSKFLIAPVKPAYRPFIARYMMKFTPWTRVSVVSQCAESFPRYVYNFSPLADIATWVGSQIYFTDVLAALMAISPVSYVRLTAASSDTPRRLLNLKDMSGTEMKLILWGARALEFDGDAVYDLGQRHHVVGIFVGLLVKCYRGETFWRYSLPIISRQILRRPRKSFGQSVKIGRVAC